VASFIPSQVCNVDFWYEAGKPIAFVFVAYWINNGQGTTLGLNKYAANDPKTFLRSG